jgi:hypothetical protein
MAHGAFDRFLKIGVIAALGCIVFTLPALAQETASFSSRMQAPVSFQSSLAPANFGNFGSAVNLSGPSFLRGISFDRPVSVSALLNPPVRNFSPGTIDRMESAFHCNDTPFVDQVRFPFAALWGGRIKLTTIESDVTTANFVMGLPGAGTVQSMNLFGSAYMSSIHTPPSDQLVAMHMTFTLRGGEVQAGDNSGLRGVQYVVRASRGFLQSFVPR